MSIEAIITGIDPMELRGYGIQIELTTLERLDRESFHGNIDVAEDATLQQEADFADFELNVEEHGYYEWDLGNGRKIRAEWP